MLRNLRKTIVSLLSAAAIMLVPVVAPSLASAACTTSSGACIQDCLSQGGDLTAPETDADCTPSGANQATTNVNDIIKTVINFFSFIVGLVAVIMIIYGGFRYISSGGDSSKITNAKNTIIYAILGLIIVAFAQIIVKFVLGKVASNT